MIVVHINGFHQVPTEFCCCPKALSEPLQLIHAKLFPATMDRPETVFTNEVLDFFHKLSLNSKSVLYDFHRTLQEISNATFPKDVPVSNLIFNQTFFLAHLANRIGTTSLIELLVSGGISIWYAEQAKLMGLMDILSWNIAERSLLLFVAQHVQRSALMSMKKL